MTFLFFLFTFFTVIYLMNLFIGLLSNAIEGFNKYEEFLLLKAQVSIFIIKLLSIKIFNYIEEILIAILLYKKIIMEIELFYMLPYQRHKKEWFPDWM